MEKLKQTLKDLIKTSIVMSFVITLLVLVFSYNNKEVRQRRINETCAPNIGLLQYTDVMTGRQMALCTDNTTREIE